MAKADDSALRYVAHLARIGVTQDELEQLQSKIDATMTLIDRMQTVDTSGIAPMAHPQAVPQPTRTDLPQLPDRDAMQSCAAKETLKNHLYLVPQVIE